MKASAIIERLGGEGAIASRLGLGPKAVWQWGNRNRIPGDWHLPLLAMARDLDVRLTEKELLSASPRRKRAA